MTARRTTIDLRDLDRQGGEWLRGEGPRSEIVISSRVRLARNIASYPFLARATAKQRGEILEQLRGPLEDLGLDARFFFVDVDAADDLVGSFLVERHLISHELKSGEGPRGVGFGSDEVVSVMVNEEDHLRIQAIQSSLALPEAWRIASEVDRRLEKQVEFAASRRFGYLTACPTNVGTGLRASVMLHLPAMVQAKQVEKLFDSAKRTGLTVRGFYGEGTMATGDLYQVSNQVTLGQTEDEIIEALGNMLPAILEYERRCRSELMSERRRMKLEDTCHRALALLRAARILSTDDAMKNLSAVRLGVVTGILDVRLQAVNELFVLAQPAHIQKMGGGRLEPPQRDIFRAEYVRRQLA